MLRVAGRRLSSSAAVWRWSSQTAPAFVSGGSHPLFITNNSDDDHSSSDFASKSPAHFFLNSKIPSLVRGFSSEALAPGNDIGIFSYVPAIVAAVKNPSSKIVYDEYNHERYPPGDPSKRAFAYFVLTGGRFVYASLIRLLILKFVLSMSASKDVLALASLEVDLSRIEPGTTVTDAHYCEAAVESRREVIAMAMASSCLSAAGGDEMIVRGTGSKSLNLYSAINQALHIALETDPRK